jgi:hypothetical protein
MKLFALPNLHYNDVSQISEPWTLPPAPEFETKDAFRAWCNSKETQHCFYSGIEAWTPSLRITVANPPRLMHALVVDYDNEDITDDHVKLIPTNGNSARLPMWVNTTFSGGRRLIWEFEKPIPIDCPELFDRFIKLLAKDLKCNDVLPAMDSSSLKSTQYFELGKNWAPIPGGQAVASDVLSLLIFEAAAQRQIQVEGPTIPIEVVAKEVEERYPNRWPGDFAVGTRGPLFWIQDGIDRVGCQVGDHGMICYSERAGKAFVPWVEIFGREFVRKYEAERVGEAAQGIWFDGRHYWRKALDGGWRHRSKDDMVMWLRGQGISSQSGAKGTASEAEKVLLLAQELRSVRAAAPVVHDNREVVKINGDNYLNISSVEIMQPASGEQDPKDFPWLDEFFTKCWDEGHPEQRDYFLAWLQHFYVPCLSGRPQQGQALIIAGEPSRGKTFFNHRILGTMMGGFSDSTDFLMGKTNFNKENAEVALWAIDDTRGASSWESHGAFSAALKKHVANPQVRVEGKGRDSFTIPWKVRIVLTCNLDKESMNIVPALNATIKDKIMLLKWGRWQAKFLSAGGTEDVVKGELPHFLGWLRDWKPPQHVLSDNPRYFVNAYHHPDMLVEAHDSSAGGRLTELLDMWRNERPREKGEKESIWMTATTLRKAISQDPSARDALKEFNRNRMAAALESVGEEYVLETRRNRGNQEYLIKLRPS